MAFAPTGKDESETSLEANQVPKITTYAEQQREMLSRSLSLVNSGIQMAALRIFQAPLWGILFRFTGSSNFMLIELLL